jgi:hypothetical protein
MACTWCSRKVAFVLDQIRESANTSYSPRTLVVLEQTSPKICPIVVSYLAQCSENESWKDSWLMIHTAKDRPQQRYSSIKVCSTLCISPAAGDERKAPSTNYKIYCDNYNVLNIRNKWLFKKNTVFKIHFIYILLNGVSLSHSV